MDGWGWNWGMGMIHGLWWVLVILGIIALVRLLGRSYGGTPVQPGPAFETSLDVLKMRYARGEILKEEFEEKTR
ncbi:MAG: SHOCT domain-containing protein [Gemmatimonadales bacterium]|nr:SHOCT domain-containing protein [Gemmatimonadales bacterium]